MADEDLTRSTARILRDLNDATASLSKAADSLSNKGVDTLLEKIKEELKYRKLLTDAQADSIKDMRKLNDEIEDLTDQYKDLIKLEKEYEKVYKAQLESAKKTVKDEAQAAKTAKRISDQWLQAKLKELKLTQEQVEVLKRGVPTLNAFIVSAGKTTAKFDGLNKEIQGLTRSVSDSVKNFFTLGSALALTKRAIMSNYDQLNKMSNRGMLGAWREINVGAFKLFTSAEKLEAIIANNRDIVNQLGGGASGISAFVDVISDARRDLEFLGQNAAEAAARFAQLSKNGGLNPKQQGFAKNMKDMSTQFRRFNGLFGDTFEDYSNLMDAIQDEEQQRNKLNALTEKGRLLELDEMRKRTENLKVLGLSNQQIVEFNRRVGETLNPQRSGQIGTRIKEAFSSQAAMQTMASMLSGSTNESDKQALAGLQKNAGVLNQLFALHGRGDAEGFKKLASSTEGGLALEAFQNAVSRTNLSDQFPREFRSRLLEQGGGLQANLDSFGKMHATAGAMGRRLTDMTEEERNKMAMSASGKGSLAESALTKLTVAIESLTNVIQNPMAQLLQAALAVVGVGALFFGKGAILKGLLRGGGALLRGGGAAVRGAGAAAGGAAPTRLFGALRGTGIGVGGSVVGGAAMLAYSGDAGDPTEGARMQQLHAEYAARKGSGSSQFGAPRNLDPRVQAMSELVSKYAAQYGVDPNVMLSMIQRESRGDPNARGTSGEIGIAQFMPQTAKELGINPYDTEDSIRGMAMYLSQHLKRFNGSYPKAIAAYNGGAGNVSSAVRKGGDNWLANMAQPGLSSSYVKGVLGNLGGTMTASAAVAGAGMYSGAGGSVAPTAPVSSTTQTTQVATSVSPELTALREQVALLAQIAVNTSKKVPAVSPSSYPPSAAVKMNGG